MFKISLSRYTEHLFSSYRIYEEPTNAFGSSYLNGGRTPGYEVGQLALPDPLEALVHLGGVHLTLHNNNQEHEKHDGMKIVVEGWNQVPSDIKNTRTVGSLKIIEVH
jgi:hypothetical protein